MSLGCEPNPDCKYAPECFENTHHLLWPANEYRSGVRRRLRNVLTVTMCAELHDELHSQTAPPKHPTEQEAIDMLLNRDAVISHMTEGIIELVGRDGH